MKTILVLTDFSPRAEVAANYAFGLAMQIHANVMLYHAFTMLGPPGISQQSWSTEDYFLRKDNIATTLSNLASKLVNSIDPSIGQFVPKITWASELGELTDAVKNQIFGDHNIVLAVMGKHGSNPAARLLLENNVNRMLLTGACPVLVVPEGAVYRAPAKVCFATDFSGSHMQVLHSLSSLCTHFGSEISLICVSRRDDPGRNIPVRAQNFLVEASTTVGYPKLYYRPVRNRSVVGGLYRSSERGPCDLFAIVHKAQSRWHRIARGSITRKVIDRVGVPLMVFPEMMASFPIF